MKKTQIIKKAIVLLMVTSMLVSTFPIFCNGGRAYAAESLAEDAKLLYGYNVTSGKNLMEPDALQTAFPIIDPASSFLEHVKRIDGTKQTSQNYSESSLTEVAEEFAQEVSAEVFGNIFVVDTDISTSFDLSKKTKKVYSEKYELFTTSISRYYYIVQLSTAEIRSFLSEGFKSDISAVSNKADAKKLFEKYGTHLNTGYTLGGRMNITNYMTTSETNHDLSLGMSLKEKVSAVLAKINVGESASIVEEYSSMENDSTSTSTYKFESFGGVATSSLTLDGLFTYNQSYVDGNNAGFMYTRWINSINEDKNLSIIGIPNGAKSVPLWDLLDSSSENYDIRRCLIDTYIEMCGDSYNEFMSQYEDLIRVSDSTYESSGVLPTFNGAYIRTPNDYFYYVPYSDFSSSGDHYGVHNGETLYLDLKYFTDKSELEYECQNCEAVNAKSGVFRITGNSGNAIISVSCQGKKEDIIRVPIQTLYCEGGMGTESYPFIITSADHLKSISKNNASSYTIYEDIDFKSGEIDCLGSFSGVLDGNYCTIKNFKIKSSKEWGLFGKNTGTIKNLRIESVGSSTNRSTFVSGGIDFKNDCKKDDYTNNSVKAVNAGIICATNNGTIDNCYVNEAYIRNIVKEDTSWFVDSELSINTGGIAGTNSGSITNCMVKDICILGSFVNTSNENTYSIYVFTGGLVGQAKSGSVSSCVVDTGSNSFIMSQIVNSYSEKNAEKTAAQAFSSGMIGYCNNPFSLRNSYVYVRNVADENAYRAIDAEYEFFEKGFLFFSSEYTPETYYALKDSVMVCGEECSLSSQDNYVYCADDQIPLSCIKPSGENGSNSNGEKDAFKEIDSVDKKEIDSETNYDQIGLSEGSFFYDKTAASTSHIAHRLSSDRSDYIRLVVDRSNQSLNETVFDGETFNPKGIEINKEVGLESTPAKIFNLKVLDENNQNVMDMTLLYGENNSYKVTPSMYSDEIFADEMSFVVSPSGIVSIRVVEDEPYHIYFDEIDKYFESWNPSMIKTEAVMSNGDITAINDLTNKELSLITKANSVVRGENVIVVNYKSSDNNTYETSYILRVDERTVSSLSIAKQPTITDYYVGESVRLDGMEVDINYEEGDPVHLSGKDLDVLEVIGSNIVEGKNTITLLYDNYDLSHSVTFEVNGLKTDDQSSNQGNLDNVEQNGSKSALVIILIVLAVIAIGAAFVWFFVIKKKKTIVSTEEEKNTNESDKEE